MLIQKVNVSGDSLVWVIQDISDVLQCNEIRAGRWVRIIDAYQVNINYLCCNFSVEVRHVTEETTHLFVTKLVREKCERSIIILRFQPSMIVVCYRICASVS
jgi:hypothetical protein